MARDVSGISISKSDVVFAAWEEYKTFISTSLKKRIDGLDYKNSFKGFEKALDKLIRSMGDKVEQGIFIRIDATVAAMKDVLNAYASKAESISSEIEADSSKFEFKTR